VGAGPNKGAIGSVIIIIIIIIIVIIRLRALSRTQPSPRADAILIGPAHAAMPS